MAVVDERGRMFGRWNVLDLALLVLLLGLIPLGYAAVVLFKDRPPRLVKVEPTQMQQAETFTLKVTGENFRPYMRLSIGTQQGREFLFKSTEQAEVPFISVPPGTYDVILYDQAQERFRLPNAITITPSNLPVTHIVAIGALGNLDAARAAKLTVGTRMEDGAEILAVGKAIPDVAEVYTASRAVVVPVPNALRVPAVIRFNCYLTSAQGTALCQVNGVTIALKNVVQVKTPVGESPFQVQRVRGPAPLQTATVRLRIVGHPSVLSKIKAGDVDTGGADTDVEVIARVVSVGPVRSVGPGASEVEVTVQASVQRVNDGWLYDSALLRVGMALPLRTAGYEVATMVLDITQP